MSKKDSVIRLLAYTGLGYITYHIVRTGYYERQNQKLARHHGDISKMSTEELKMNEKVKHYNENHFGKIIIENLYSRKYLKDKIKIRLEELERERIMINSKLYETDDEYERKDFIQQMGVIQEEMEKLKNFSNQMRHSNQYDLYGDEDVIKEKQSNPQSEI